MQTKLGGIAAFCVGATLIVSCGGGGADGSIDDTGSPGVVGGKSAGGAPGNAGGTAKSPSAAGAADTTAPSATGTIPGADVTNTGAAGATPDATDTTPGAAPGAAGTTPSAAGTTAGAATAPATAPAAGKAGATIVPLYTYPTDAGYADHPGDIEHVAISTSGGAMQIVSRLGEGTTVLLWLPVAPDVRTIGPDATVSPVAVENRPVDRQTPNRR